MTGLPLESRTGLPFFITGVAKSCPMIFEPSSLPFDLICWPLALPGKTPWLMPSITSG